MKKTKVVDEDELLLENFAQLSNNTPALQSYNALLSSFAQVCTPLLSMCYGNGTSIFVCGYQQVAAIRST